MRSHLTGRFLVLGLCATLGAASSATSPTIRQPRTILIPPQASHRNAPQAQLRGRRVSVPTCSGSGLDSFVGGKDGNVAAGADTGVVSGQLNQACDERAVIAGGYGGAISSGANTASNSFIGAGINNVITGNGGYAVIGAGEGNLISNSDAFIGAGNNNTVSNTSGFIGAGASNSAIGVGSAIAAGSTNTASAVNDFIGAGFNNRTSGVDAVIGGGYNNIVAGFYGVIGGGQINRASGTYATVPGGYENFAGGFASFAGGDAAAAVHTGTFVWSDAAGGKQLVSSAPNQFLAKASGGVKFYSNAALTTGVSLAAGSGTWASASDRALKTDVVAIDDTHVLDKVAALPISEWSYTSERGVRHVGPMAQDFYAAFGIGEDDRHITSIDENGVALAAIKALHAQLAKVKAADAAQLADVRAQLKRLAAEVAAMRSK